MKIFTKLNRLSLRELIFLILILACSSSFAATYYVRTDGSDANSGTSNTAGGAFLTISHAISFASPGDTIQVANGSYAENLVIGKSLILNGQNNDSTLVAGSLAISSSTVTVSNIQFKDSSGVAVGTGLSSITFTNVKSDSSKGDGAVFNSVSGLSISNSQFSYNTNTGLKILSCSNVTLTNVTATSNGQGGVTNGNGISLYGVATATVTNANASSNARHGLSISASGNSNITISGGTFNSNGTNPGHKDGSGGGINVYANSFTVSGVTISDTVLADSNKTAGILLFSENSSSDITNVTVRGSVTLAGNGGAGAVVYGKSSSINISASFNRTTVSGAAGVVVVGSDAAGSNSPTGVTISNSTFTGYSAATNSYAISLGGTNNDSTRIGTSSVNATSDNNFGTTDNFEIEKLIKHKVDNNSLGLVSWVSNNIYIPSNMSIQSGIGAASSGNTINVQSGTYTQNLTIDKNVTLKAFAPPYAVISPAAGDCITVNSPVTTVAIHGFDLNPVSGSFGIKNTTSSTVDGTNNWWRTTSSDTIQTKISNTGGSVTFDPFYGKPTNNGITNSNLNNPIKFSNSDASLEFTYLPDNTNATITLSQTPDVPTGLPSVPSSFGSANPVYLTITATGLTNGTFWVTIVLDVSNISGFGPNSQVVFFNTTTQSWELISGTYDGTAQTFTFETNHFTTFGFLTSGTFVYNITMGNIVTNTGATVAIPVKLNTNGNAGFNQFQAKFTYPGSKFEFISGNIGTGTLMNSNGWVTFFTAKSGSGSIDTVQVIGVSLSNTTGNGTDVFFKLNFKIIDTSSGSDSIRGNTRDFYANGVDSVFLITHNTITYTSGSLSTVRGDATLDSLVNIDDVNAIIDHLNGIAALTGQAFINAAAADNDTTSLSVNDITYILYYISHGNTWPTSPLSINPNTEANVTFTNAAQSTQGNYKLLSLPVNISAGSKVVNNLEMIVKFDQSQMSYQYFQQDQSTLLNGDVNNIIVDARNQGMMAENLSSGEVRFLFASSDPQQNIVPGKIIFVVSGNSPLVTSRYRINNETSFKDGPKYGVTAVDNSGNTIPAEFSVSQNYPNPFNPSTIIKYALPKESFVSIKIYNILGQEVKTLVNEDKTAGTYNVQWNGENNFGESVSSGAYIYRVVAGEKVETKKMILLR